PLPELRAGLLEGRAPPSAGGDRERRPQSLNFRFDPVIRSAMPFDDTLRLLNRRPIGRPVTGTVKSRSSSRSDSGNPSTDTACTRIPLPTFVTSAVAVAVVMPRSTSALTVFGPAADSDRSGSPAARVSAPKETVAVPSTLPIVPERKPE